MVRSRKLLVALAVLAAVLVRLLQLRYPLSADEAGFLTIGGGWDATGAHLYGDHWVDRPPLLIAIYRLAETTGGMLSLRVIGLLVTALAVWLASRAARCLAGPAAAVPAAWTAALLLSTPLVSIGRVDGELLATPFVLAGIWAAIAAFSTSRGIGSATLRAALSGAAAAPALLVKQNFADVGVFVAVAAAATLAARRVNRRRVAAILAGFSAGALGLATVVVLWAWSRGVAPADLFEALYPFRLEAAEAINGDSASVTERRVTLRWAALLGGAIPLTAVALPLLWRSPRPAVWALFAVIGYGGLSIVLGGSAWLHYLIQLCGPVAVIAGVAFAHYGRTGRRVVGFVLSALLVISLGAFSNFSEEPVPDARARSGSAIAAVAEPDDSVTVFPFGANIAYATGLDTPYPYLWLLPALVRDTDLSLLGDLLSGDEAPTWIVLTASPRSWPDYGFTGPTDLLDARYEQVAELCHRPVYLLKSADRQIPTDPCA